MIEQAKKQLQELEHYKEIFYQNNDSIFDIENEIEFQIDNSKDLNNHVLWEMVLDLYNDKYLIDKARTELSRIEYSKRTWKDVFAREMEIWEAIAMNINSDLSNQEKKLWELVMDLYNEKYR